MKLSHIPKVKFIRGFTIVELLVTIAIIASVAAISSPIILRQIASSRATQALNNGKDIYTGIRDLAFRQDGKTFTGGTASNSTEVFNNLFASGVISDEKPFYVKGVTGKVQGNEDGTLDPTENVFSVFLDPSSQAAVDLFKGSVYTPLIATPAGDTSGNLVDARWDVRSYGGNAVVIYKDGSAEVFSLIQLNAASDGSGAIIDPETDVQIDATSQLAESPFEALAP